MLLILVSASDPVGSVQHSAVEELSYVHHARECLAAPARFINRLKTKSPAHVGQSALLAKLESAAVVPAADRLLFAAETTDRLQRESQLVPVVEGLPRGRAATHAEGRAHRRKRPLDDYAIQTSLRRQAALLQISPIDQHNPVAAPL